MTETMVAHSTPERAFRGPGCSEDCQIVRAIVPGVFGRSELLLHDPGAHERHGRLMAPEPASVAGDMIVHTGGLVVDRWQRRAFAFGRDVLLSGLEWRLLDYLAARANRYIPTAEIVRAVWDQWATPHNARIYFARLRARLGACADLIETRPNHGYRLRLDPPTDSEMTVPQRRWSRAFDFCVCCGKTGRAHAAQGRCDRCRTKGNRQPHYGPCGAPPSGSDGAP